MQLRINNYCVKYSARALGQQSTVIITFHFNTANSFSVNLCVAYKTIAIFWSKNLNGQNWRNVLVNMRTEPCALQSVNNNNNNNLTDRGMLSVINPVKVWRLDLYELYANVVRELFKKLHSLRFVAPSTGLISLY